MSELDATGSRHPSGCPWDEAAYDDDLDASVRYERSLPVRELLALLVVAVVIVVRQLWCV